MKYLLLNLRLLLVVVFVGVTVFGVMAQPGVGGNGRSEGALYEPKKVTDASFRFALFTDLHISTENPNNSVDLKAAIEDVNAQKGVAFVLVTGDVTELGDLASLQLAKSLLSRLSVPYYIVPGNHETKWSESGATDFKRVFGDDKFRIQMNGLLFIGFNSGPVAKMGDGHVSPEDLYWLGRQLKNAGKKRPVFLVTHYPLKGGDVANWNAVTDMARKHNLQGVLNGHYHRNMILDYDGIPGVVNRSVLRGKDSVGGYTLFTVSDSLYIAEKRIGEEAFQWGALSLTPKMYVEPDGKLRPSYGVNSKYRQVKRVWEQSLGSSIYGSAGEGNGLVFVGLNNGLVKALSADKGKVVWKYQTQSRIVSTPVAVGDVVLVASTDGNLYCLRGKSGELVWKFRSGRPLLGIPTVSDDVVYIGGSNGKFYALQLSSGEELWSYDDLGSFVETKPVVTDNAVIFGAWDSYLYALDKRSGALLWRWNNGNERKHFSAAAVWPVVSNGKVYVAAPDRYLTGVNLSDGSTAWRTNETQVRESVGMSVDGKTLYSRSMNDSVVAYDVTGSLPALKWKVNAEYGYDHNPTMMVERNGVVVFATKNGEVVAVNAADGSVKWRHKIGNATINTLTPVGSADWVVTTVDGLVVRLTER